MDVYAVDSMYQRTNLIDTYVSLLWTERWSAFGDFKLTVDWSSKNAEILYPGQRLVVNDGLDVMVVDTVEITNTWGEPGVMTVSGRSATAFLEQRIARRSSSNDPAQLLWQIDKHAGFVMADVVDLCCVTPFPWLADDAIPHMTTGLRAFGPKGVFTIPVGTVYDVVKAIADSCGLGFRLISIKNTGHLTFVSHEGRDKTDLVFGRDLDNLINTKELNSISVYKNVAYVFANIEDASTPFCVVNAPGVPTPISGLDRRVIMVEASDITETGPDMAVFMEALRQKGLDALASNSVVMGFDGEVSPDSMYVYNRDYIMGDVVSYRSDSGKIYPMRVTEYIRSNDAQGAKNYPTLTAV